MSIFDPVYIDHETDTNVKKLVLNRMDKERFDELSTHSPDELWFIQDSSLSGQPIVVDTRPVVLPTKLSELSNDVGYCTSAYVTSRGYATQSWVNNKNYATQSYVSAYVQQQKTVWADWDVTSASTAYVTTNNATFNTGLGWQDTYRLEFAVRGTSNGNRFIGNSNDRFFNTSPGSIEGANVYFDFAGARIHTDGVWDVSEWYDVETYNYGFVCTPRSGGSAIVNSSTSRTHSPGILKMYIGEGGLSFDFGYLRIYDGDVLVKSYLPSLDANQVACMYEEVSQQYEYPTNGSWIYHDE